MIWPVTVVPTLAPMIMPRDCLRVIMPAATRPEVITMVAVDDWINAVTRSPSRNALIDGRCSVKCSDPSGEREITKTLF